MKTTSCFRSSDPSPQSAATFDRHRVSQSHKTRHWLATAALIAALTGTAPAQVPQLINYQGRVAVNGANFDGTGQFKFALVNADATATYWTNAPDTAPVDGVPDSPVALTVTKGLYSVLLGDATLTNMAVMSSTVFNNPDVRLRVWFDDATHGPQLLSPDQRIAAVGYAMMAGSVPDAAITSAKLATGAVGAAKIAVGAVGTNQLAAGAIQSGHITSGAVGSAQIASGAVGSAKLDPAIGLWTRNGNNISYLAGSVGIGTSSPTAAFDVTGTVKASSFAGSGAGLILSGTYSSAVTFNHSGNSFSGSGTGLTGVNADRLDGFHAADFARLQSSPTFTGSLYAGSLMVGGGIVGTHLMIGNGHSLVGPYASIAGGSANAIYSSDYACIGGGDRNWIKDNADKATIAGGSLNVIDYDAYEATIGGGAGNQISAARAVIAGGTGNTNIGPYSAILGGWVNGIVSGGNYSTIGGGVGNTISASYGCIPGGLDNRVAGAYGFAGGRRARADHQGCFVWGDSTDADVGSWQNNQFIVRASGGVRMFTNAGNSTGSYLNPSGSSWQTVCDRNVKKNFREANTRELLAKLMTVPITWWNYKSEPDGAVPHLGPMAQDFVGTFFPGDDDKGIGTLQFDGVALAAIQGLYEELKAEALQRSSETQALQVELADKAARLASLEQRLAELEKHLKQAK